MTTTRNPIGYWDAVCQATRLVACQDDAFRRSSEMLRGKGRGGSPRLDYLLPFARLCVTHNISQFLRSVSPPFDQAVTWSASISATV